MLYEVITPLLRDHIMPKVTTEVIGKGLTVKDNGVDNVALIQANEAIRNHPIEQIGKVLRGYMKDMKRIAVGVITSYSIHYTKLYESWVGWNPFKLTRTMMISNSRWGPWPE